MNDETVNERDCIVNRLQERLGTDRPCKTIFYCSRLMKCAEEQYKAIFLLLQKTFSSNEQKAKMTFEYTYDLNATHFNSWANDASTLYILAMNVRELTSLLQQSHNTMPKYYVWWQTEQHSNVRFFSNPVWINGLSGAIWLWEYAEPNQTFLKDKVGKAVITLVRHAFCPSMLFQPIQTNFTDYPVTNAIVTHPPREPELPKILTELEKEEARKQLEEQLSSIKMIMIGSCTTEKSNNNLSSTKTVAEFVDTNALENTNVENNALENTNVENNALENTNVETNALENTNVETNALKNTNVETNALKNTNVETNALENTNVETNTCQKANVETSVVKETIEANNVKENVEKNEANIVENPTLQKITENQSIKVNEPSHPFGRSVRVHGNGVNSMNTTVLRRMHHLQRNQIMRQQHQFRMQRIQQEQKNGIVHTNAVVNNASNNRFHRPRTTFTETGSVASGPADVLFLGALAGHQRNQVIHLLKSKYHLTVSSPPRGRYWYAEEREKQIRSCKVCINVHYFRDPSVLETARLNLLLVNGAAIVSERSTSQNGIMDARYEKAEAVIFVNQDDIDGLCQKVNELCRNDEKRAEQQRKALAFSLQEEQNVSVQAKMIVEVFQKLFFA